MTPEEINKKVTETIPAEIEREMQEIAELAPCCDFCHSADILDREEWCKEKFRHFYAAGMLAERERMMGGALCGHVDMCGVSAWVELPSKVLTEYLRSNFKEGDKVRVIIIKEVGK